MIITPGFPANEGDTTCIPALQIFTRALLDEGIKVSVIPIHYPFSEVPYDWFGAKVYPLNGRNKRRRVLLHKRKAVHIANEIHEKKPVNVVHSFWLNESTKVGKAVAKSLSSPLVATVMGQEMRNAKPGFKRWRNSNFPIVALCRFQAEQLRKKQVEASHIIPWGVEKTNTDFKSNDLICIGSLIPLKNIGYFVELCAHVHATHPDLSARIIGDGPLSSVLQQRINAFGLTENVKLMGELSYGETQELIAQSKVLVHPSEFEGFGMTIIEAIANGTHVISTPVGIADELEIPHLTEDPAIDTAMLQMLLKTEAPEPVLHDIKASVRAYFLLYGF